MVTDAAAALLAEGYADPIAIGRGGLGDVYRARHTATGRLVAVKVLRDVSDTSVAWHRTRRELTALRALSGHANVVQLVDVLELEVGPALVMEHADGGSVADLLAARGGTLSVGEAVFVGRQTAAALVSAHVRGIVHRDIKPQNLLIDAAGQVQLCDFGIATLVRDDAYRSRTNAVSLRYASPEDLEHDGADGDAAPHAHAGAAAVGPASDVYSLGATLLHVVHGAPPTLKDRLAPWEPPHTTDPDRAAFDRVLARCLHPVAAMRPSAQGLLDALDGLALGAGTDRVEALEVAHRASSRPGPPAEQAELPSSPEPFVELVESAHAAAEPAAVQAPPPRTAGIGSPDAIPPRPAGPGRRGEPRRPDPGARPWRPAAAVVVVGVAVLVAIVVLLWPRDAVAPVLPGAPALSTVPGSPPASATLPPPTASLGAVPLATVPRPEGLPPLDAPSWDAGGVGDCLVQVDVDDVLSVVSCEEPHDLQRIATGSTDELAGLAGATELDPVELEGAVVAACTSAFVEFVGRGLETSDLGLVQQQPSAESWAEGARGYACYVGMAGYRIVGDARNSGW
jgi:hypothetical protein